MSSKNPDVLLFVKTLQNISNTFAHVNEEDFWDHDANHAVINYTEEQISLLKSPPKNWSKADVTYALTQTLDIFSQNQNNEARTHLTELHIMPIWGESFTENIVSITSFDQAVSLLHKNLSDDEILASYTLTALYENSDIRQKLADANLLEKHLSNVIDIAPPQDEIAERLLQILHEPDVKESIWPQLTRLKYNAALKLDIK
jgi:hypothetical protein